MYWFAITQSLAAALPAVEDVPLEPYLRVWGGGGSCDATSIFVEAAERIEGDPWRDPAGEAIFHNMHVLEAWERGRNCGTVDRRGPAPLRLFNFGGVLVAAARNALNHDPSRAVDLAVEAFTFGNDAAVGSLVSSMVGASIQQSALEVVAEAWPYLGSDARDVVSRRLRQLRRLSPPLDLEGERDAMRRNAEAFQAESWLPVAWCLDAHGDAMDRVEAALQDDHPRSMLEPTREPAWLGWGCDRGIDRLVGDWLDEQDLLEAQLIVLETSR